MEFWGFKLSLNFFTILLLGYSHSAHLLAMFSRYQWCYLSVWLSRRRPVVAIPGKGVRCQWGQFGMRASPYAPSNIESLSTMPAKYYPKRKWRKSGRKKHKAETNCICVWDNKKNFKNYITLSIITSNPPLSRRRPVVVILGKGVRCQWGQFGMLASPYAPPNIGYHI